ncbi:MAG: hypothetical protein ATN31_11350 [Candidatus Epulonipiscioides saccharophilum]|nr:MAG: hypothetical protein ATN31_11350 [Epulopiscium sp. AS2M-Bin001]
MEFIANLLFNIIGLGLSIITILFKLFVALLGGLVVLYKRKSVPEFIIAFIIIFLYPFLALFSVFVPHKIFHLRKDIRYHPAFVGRDPHIASVFALTGMISKFDGQITKEEIRKVRAYVGDFFGITAETIDLYQESFVFGKEHPEEVQEFSMFIANNYNRLVRSQIIFLFMLIAIKDDKSLDQSMEQFLLEIASIMGISFEEFKFLKMQATGQYSQHTDFNSQPPEVLIKKYSAVLGVDEQASFTDIKKAYRKLAKEYHPDNYKDKPQDYITLAENKMREINVAYEYLEKVKGDQSANPNYYKNR